MHFSKSYAGIIGIFIAPVGIRLAYWPGLAYQIGARGYSVAYGQHGLCTVIPVMLRYNNCDNQQLCLDNCLCSAC